MEIDHTIKTLLDLDETVYGQEDGHWVKIEAKEVEVSKVVPHGIKYSLTLHDKKGVRIMGYDNSHVVKPPAKYKYAGQCLPYDHKHRHAKDKGIPYEFQNAAQLLTDFFEDVDKVIKERKDG